MKWGKIDPQHGAMQARCGHFELWEMEVHHIESALRMMNAAAEAHERNEHGSRAGFPKNSAGYIFYLAWLRVKRQFRLTIKMLDRELKYRAHTDYRGFVRAIRLCPKDATLLGVFADWCDEGHTNMPMGVMARRLRRKAKRLIESKSRKYSRLVDKAYQEDKRSY